MTENNEFTNEDLENLLVFLKRTNLQGAEVEVFTQLVEKVKANHSEFETASGVDMSEIEDEPNGEDEED